MDDGGPHTALAGIADKDEYGRYVDFHNLRVSLSTLLAAHRVSPRAAQALMRHSDPRLTAAFYTDEKILPLAAELQNVPKIPCETSAARTRPSGPRCYCITVCIVLVQFLFLGTGMDSLLYIGRWHIARTK